MLNHTEINFQPIILLNSNTSSSEDSKLIRAFENLVRPSSVDNRAKLPFVVIPTVSAASSSNRIPRLACFVGMTEHHRPSIKTVLSCSESRNSESTYFTNKLIRDLVDRSDSRLIASSPWALAKSILTFAFSDIYPGAGVNILGLSTLPVFVTVQGELDTYYQVVPDNNRHSVTGYSVCERQLTVDGVLDTVVEFYKNECGINPEWSVDNNLESIAARSRMPRPSGVTRAATVSTSTDNNSSTRSRRLLT